jgi:hypothetical protein
MFLVIMQMVRMLIWSLFKRNNQSIQNYGVNLSKDESYKKGNGAAVIIYNRK